MTDAHPSQPSFSLPAAQRRAVFARIARQYEPDLMRLAKRLCPGDHDRAEDLVQETLVRAYQAYVAGRFDDNANPRPWLLRILTNIFINEHNRRRKWDSPTDFDTLTSQGEAGPAATHAAPDDIPGVRMLAQLLDEELEMALMQLSEPLRLCIILVDIEELDYAEAAASLGIPIGTVRSRLSRARMQLQDLLADYARRKGLR